MKRSAKLMKRAVRLILIGVSMLLAAVVVGSFSYVLWLELYEEPGVLTGALALWLLVWGVIHVLDAWDVFRAAVDEREWEVARGMSAE